MKLINSWAVRSGSSSIGRWPTPGNNSTARFGTTLNSPVEEDRHRLSSTPKITNVGIINSRNVDERQSGDYAASLFGKCGRDHSSGGVSDRDNPVDTQLCQRRADHSCLFRHGAAAGRL
ncbi:MAG TPA: hypothetical protein VLZ05_16400, partial [Mycobacterium sp.]